MKQLEGKVVWITGASSGIGEALAYAFASHGARLVLSSRRSEELERVKRGCQNVEVQIVPMDVSIGAEIPQTVEKVLSKMGRIDILVNSAGVSQRSIAADTSIEVYRTIMEINYFGTVQLCKAVLPHFLNRNEGHYVTISSVAGMIGLPFRTAYCASKHALEGFSAALRIELWKTNIKILVVRPGAVRTGIAHHALLGNGELFEKNDPMIDQGLNPSDVANAIVKGVVGGKKELYITSAREGILLKLNRFMPALTFGILKKMVP